MKVVWETLKIFGASEEDLKVSCTAVRIPILRAHSEAITIETVSPVTAAGARCGWKPSHLFPFALKFSCVALDCEENVISICSMEGLVVFLLHY